MLYVNIRNADGKVIRSEQFVDPRTSYCESWNELLGGCETASKASENSELSARGTRQLSDTMLILLSFAAASLVLRVEHYGLLIANFDYVAGVVGL